ncbi:MAG: NADH-quinone oxidoreductase subunit NuoE [Planctomycetota bacterium]|nr:NADH-quinone oxidoreductase subunit NuoE [Planctomycetota bacterium]
MPAEASLPKLVDEIVERHRYEDYALVGILQDLQKELRWLPREVLRQVADRLDVPLSRVYAIATFYKAFSLKPRGKHLMLSCQGTACHVRGGARILENVERQLGVKTGETTRDGQFTVEKVRCVGCCSLAPVVMINADTHGRLTSDKLMKIIKKYE